MNNMNKMRNWFIVGAAALTVGLTAVAVYPQVTQAQDATATPDIVAPHTGKADQQVLFAAALGITVEQLQAAQETARDAAMAQAVADGEITQEQADEMAARDMGRGMERWGGSDEHATFLATALGITVEELEAAQESARDAAIAQAVAEGRITQEQADEMATWATLREFIAPQLESAYTTAIQAAVTAGIITQEQADQFLSDEGGMMAPGLRHGGFGPGMGGRGRGFGGREFGGHGPDGLFGEDVPDAQPESQPDATTP